MSLLSERQILSLKLTRPGTCLLAFVCRPAPITVYFGLSSSVKGFWLCVFFFLNCFPCPSPFLPPLPASPCYYCHSGLGFKEIGKAECGRHVVTLSCSQSWLHLGFRWLRNGPPAGVEAGDQVVLVGPPLPLALNINLGIGKR